MRRLRILLAAALAYAALVVAFEAYLGIVQPRFGDDAAGEWGGTIVITTADADGSTEDRVVVPMVDGGQLYVSANHWPRSWYRRAMANPSVQVTAKEETKDFRAVPVEPGGTEHERLARTFPHPAWFRFLTGYPPRRFVRLEPR